MERGARALQGKGVSSVFVFWDAARALECGRHGDLGWAPLASGECWGEGGGVCLGLRFTQVHDRCPHLGQLLFVERHLPGGDWECMGGLVVWRW